MPNICGFGLTVHGSGEELQKVAEWLNSQCDEQCNIKTPGSWVQLYGKCELSPDEPGVLLIQGEAKNNPGLFLASMVAERFPTLRVQIGGSDEDGNAELWELQGGHARLLDFSSEIVFDTFGVEDYEVHDGFRLSREERIEMAYQQVVDAMAYQDDLLAGKDNDKSPEEWKDAIRKQLSDQLPGYFDDDFIQSLPQHEQGERHEQATTAK